MPEFSVGDRVVVRAKMTRIAAGEDAYTFRVVGYTIPTTSSRHLMQQDLAGGVSVDELKPGDEIILSAEVTVVGDHLVTVRIGGWSHPMTLRADFVSAK